MRIVGLGVDWKSGRSADCLRAEDWPEAAAGGHKRPLVQILVIAAMALAWVGAVADPSHGFARDTGSATDLDVGAVAIERTDGGLPGTRTIAVATLAPVGQDFPRGRPVRSIVTVPAPNRVILAGVTGAEDEPDFGRRLLVLFVTYLLIVIAYVVATRNAALRKEIKERKRIEEALRTSDERYRDLYENAPNAHVSISPTDGSILGFNSMLLQLLGYDRSDLEGMKLFDLFADTPQDLAEANLVFEKFKRGEPIQQAELQMERKDGTPIWIGLLVLTVKDATGNVTEGRAVLSDITDRKQAEAQVIQAAKLATLGEMATGVAHELNQPLNVIRMAAGNVLRKLEKGTADPAYLSEKLERVAAQTQRAAAIIDHMRMFGRRATESPRELDPRETIRGALDMIGEQLRLNEIEIDLNVPDACRPIRGHLVQMEQVLLNLLTNARDAIQGNDSGGERKIRVSLEDGGGDTVKISVHDSGGGIPESTLDRIFEPFFTTKELDKGTGLGLSVSYGIIRDMGGSIEAANVDGGARFTLNLPACEWPAESGPDERPDPHPG
jgi:PAS domain S-box-containing protein